MTGLIFHLIPHTHWDREWYLPAATFQARLIAVVDDLMERLQADPGYRSFLLDGQTVLVEDYLRARPERESDVRALVKTGRLQVGPWYVLADEQIPSGEALVRNLLLGAADAERLGGRLDVLYSPDAFGHPAAWPTLAREFGIRYGVVWRGLGGEAGQERDLYRWRGLDGKDVLLWHLPPAGYEIGAALPTDADRLFAAWATVRGALVARAAGKHIPVFIGADHHAAHPEVSRLRDLLAELDPQSAFRVSRLDEFFQAAAEGAKPAALAGELRWSYRFAWTLQGVHATRAPLKRRYSAAELLLERHAEPLAALARRSGGRDRRSLLELAWRALVRCQFHDALAGCASDEVARAMEARLMNVEAVGAEIVRGSVLDLVRHDPDVARERAADARPALVLWNPAARPRGGVVVADLTLFRRDVAVGPPSGRTPRAGDGYRPFAVVGPDQRAVPVQLLDRRITTERIEAARHYPDLDEVAQVRVAFLAPPVPGLGFQLLGITHEGTRLTPGARRSAGEIEGASVKGRSLVNHWVEVALEPAGSLALHDRRTGERFSDVLRLEDGGDAGDTYTYCPPARDRTRRAAGPITVRRLAAGPLVAALEARFEIRQRVGVRLVVMLAADSPIVRCILDIDNRATWHRLRARIPTKLGGAAAVAGTAFGAVARAPVVANARDYPLETPVATAPAHRFAAAADGRRGLALLAPGFFEYEWTAGGDLVVTLLRAVGELSRGELATRPGHAGWPTVTPLAQCLGASRVELAVAPVSQAEVERGDAIPSLWEDVFLPVRGFWLRDAIDPVPPSVDVVLEGSGLVISAVKPAHQGSPMLLRCYNATDRPAAGAWRFGGGADSVKTAHRVRADERESVGLVLEGRGKTVRFTAEPHEIVTILVT
ncbi:MAG TPA: glycoside hydrolase family 38 C-terminal domain-containing protein [Gemmatimonadales bacterium]|nr:glycoside hydrolase family 38 C-terminal domain-containing protein [Gemmatimonadales bacterium]